MTTFGTQAGHRLRGDHGEGQVQGQGPKSRGQEFGRKILKLLELLETHESAMKFSTKFFPYKSLVTRTFYSLIGTMVWSELWFLVGSGFRVF